MNFYILLYRARRVVIKKTNRNIFRQKLCKKKMKKGENQHKKAFGNASRHIFQTKYNLPDIS